MKRLLLILVAGCCASQAPAANSDLKESKFTQVVNDAQVISPADNAKHAATVDGIFKLPDVLRTGPASRVEMVAEDKTITRVGANTIFSFDPANRSIDLKQGSLLFNSPKGKGGGSIHTAAATAAVLGTTIIVVTTPDGGFKVLVLEGVAQVQFQNGQRQRLRAGQLIFVLPGGKPGPILAFRLDEQINGSKLVTGFLNPLPSMPLIYQQIANQIHQIQSGSALDTGLLVGNHATSTTVQIINPIQQVNAGPNPSSGSGVTGNPSTAGSAPGTNNNGVTPPPGVPTAPPGTIVASGGGYLTPDGFVFTSFTTNASGGAGPGPAYAQGPATATLSDAVISTPTLDPTRVFTQGVQVTIPTSADFSGFADGGFFARNITFTTASIDFSPYTGLELPNFVFFASENMSFQNSVSLSAFPLNLVFFAGNQLTMNPSTTISANSTLLELGSRLALSLDSVNINNTGGQGALVSFSSITLNNSTLSSSVPNGTTDFDISNQNKSSTGGDVSLNNTTVNSDAIFIDSPGNLSLTGTTPAAGQITATSDILAEGDTGLTVGVNLVTGTASGAISLASTGGNVTVNNGAQLTASQIALTAPSGDVLVDTLAPVQASSMTVTAGSSAGNTATIQNTSLANLSTLAVTAYTVVLNNVNMAGQVSLNSFNGALAPNPNTSAAIVSGDVNFIKQVNYNGSPAQNFINNGITIGKLP